MEISTIKYIYGSVEEEGVDFDQPLPIFGLISTYNCFFVCWCWGGEILIRQRSCVEKTYTDFWTDLHCQLNLQFEVDPLRVLPKTVFLIGNS